MVDVASNAPGPEGLAPRPRPQRLNWAIALFALIIAILVDGVILGGLLRQRQQGLGDASLVGERIAQALSEHASQVVGRADQVLLGTIDALAPRLLRPSDDDAEISAILNRYLAPLPYASGLVVVDAEGRIKYSASALSWLHEAPGFVPPACRGVEQAVAPLQGATASPGTMLIAMTQLRENCRAQLVLARRVSDLPDQPAVVVAIVIEPSAFQRYYDQISGGLNGHAGLWTMDRRLAIGSSAIADQVGAAPETLAVAEMIDASRQDHRPQTLAPEGGAVRLVSVHGVSRLPLIATVSMDRATLLARWSDRAFNAAVAGAIVTLAIAAMALALMRVAARIDDARHALRASEARFRDFAAASSDWYWEQDENCRFTYMSPSASHHTTISPSNHMGRTRRELNPLGPTPKQWEEHEALLRAHLPFRNLQFHRIAHDGALRHYSVSGVPVFDGQGRFAGYRGTGTDITADVQAREALRAVIDAMPAMVNAKDQDSRYVMMNVYQAKMYGTTPTEALGKTAAELLGASYGNFTRDLDIQVIESGKPTDFYEERYASADGIERDWLTVKVPLFDAAGRAYRVISVSTDITRRKAADRHLAQIRMDLQSAKDAAEAANNAKTNFLANMSHELRTPLNAVLGFSEVMEKEILGPIGTPRYREFAAGIHKSGTMLLQLINDVLDMAKIEAGHRDLLREPVDLRNVADDALLVIRQRAQGAGIALDVQIAEDLPPIVADHRALAQILVNLLTNAVKFTPAGGTITLAIRHAEGRFTFQVADTGCGIPADMLDRLGTPFLQVQSSMTRSHEGTGLGLALIKSLVALHDGAFKIDSTEGKGTTVTVTLPDGQGQAQRDAAD